MTELILACNNGIYVVNLYISDPEKKKQEDELKEQKGKQLKELQA